MDMDLDKLTAEQLERLGAVTMEALFNTHSMSEKAELKQYLLQITLTHHEKLQKEREESDGAK